MILRDNLYTVVGKEDTSDGASYVIRINPRHFIYEAHFPGEPVTPGVCVLQIAQELLALETKEELTLKSIKNAKFTAVISPRQSTELIVSLSRISATDKEVSCQCIMGSVKPELICAKLSFTCAKNG